MRAGRTSPPHTQHAHAPVVANEDGAVAVPVFPVIARELFDMQRRGASKGQSADGLQ